uniref:B2 protein n=1 Tax=Anthurium amnicola TaxID=1678845 RepID=A0A1D1YZI2_9ARAE
MANEFWQFSDQLRLETTSSFANLSIGDSIWADSFLSKSRPEDRRNFDNTAAPVPPNPIIGAAGQLAAGKQPQQPQQQSLKGPVLDLNGGGWKAAMGGGKSAFANSGGFFNKEVGRQPANLFNRDVNKAVGGFGHPHRKNIDNNDVGKGKGVGKKSVAGNRSGSNNDKNNNDKAASDKRFKTLPASEALPRSEAVGGYIFVCNNDTMQENLRRQLFGLPPRYRDSVRAITPGLPLFLYNYSTHQLHGIFEAASFGGTNIDPSAWEDKKCHGESRFPAQVRVVTRKICEPLEEDSFRPILHHYDGPKFRLELSVPEALGLLDIFAENNA